MILLSALHALLVGALLLGVAAPTARLLRTRNRNERWVWAAALAGAVTLPLLLRFLPQPSSVLRGAPGGAAPPAGGAWVTELPGLWVGPVASMADWLSPVLLGLWALASGVLAVRLAMGMVVLHRLRARSAPVDGSELPLLRTEDTGPAVVGFFRPAILIPESVLRLPRGHRDWIVRHEAEHLRARDPLLLALVLAARIAVPWNPFVWVLGRKLRTAIEIDCDRRTVGRGAAASIESYVEALLRVVRTPVRPLPAGAFAFAESRLPLDERIRSMTTQRRPVSTGLRLGLAGLAILVLAVACELPTPSTTDGEDDPAAQAAVAEDERASAPAQPAFTPFTKRPEILNREDVARALRDAYPDPLREAGIGGRVIVWFYVNVQGRVEQTRVAESSGHPELDRAALQVADAFEFEPARNGGELVPVWVRFPISFQPR